MNITKAQWVQALKASFIQMALLCFFWFLLANAADFIFSNTHAVWLGYVLVFVFFIVFTSQSFRLNQALMALFTNRTCPKCGHRLNPEDRHE